MIRAAVAFFILALLAYALGAGQLVGFSIEVGKILLITFLILSVISYAASLLITAKKT
jgi:uncharacterized membrane protein YtjA (UPF0391 family)